MFDLQFMAFQADITRVSTLLLAAENSRTNYAEIGSPLIAAPWQCTRRRLSARSRQRY